MLLTLDPLFNTGPTKSIASIEIDELFGRFSQQLDISAATGNRLGLLYGFNGTGKTTILRLIESLLAASIPSQKVRVYRLEFKSFQINMSDGTCIGFRRNGDSRIGPFDMYIRDKTELAFPFPEHLEGFLQENRPGMAEIFLRTVADRQRFQKIQTFVSDHVPNLVVLPADRNTEARTTSLAVDRQRVGARNPNTNLGLQVAIDRLLMRLQLRARRDSNAADSVAFDVFSKMVQNVATRKKAPEEDMGILIETLRAQIENIHKYSDIGLTTTVDADPLIKTLQSARQQRVSVVRELMTPYLQSQEAKLKSLDTIYRIVTKFVSTLNSFYRAKSVSLDLLNGLRILGGNGEKLQPGVLSSGERQLMLMFCKCTALEQNSNIVLIDEPELSLNSEWVRVLIRQLLNPELTGNVQFLMATHSTELLSQYEEAVIELKVG